MTIFETNHRVLFLDFDGVLHPLSPDLIMDSNLPLSELIAVHDFFRWVPLVHRRYCSSPAWEMKNS